MTGKKRISTQAELEVTATKFTKNFGRYQDEAQSSREPVRVTKHGRVIGGWLSAQELEHFERLKRQVHIVGELPNDIRAAIAGAEYGVGPQPGECQSQVSTRKG